MQKRIRTAKPIIFSLASVLAMTTISTTVSTINWNAIEKQNSINRLAFDNISQIPNLDTTNQAMFNVSPSNISRYNGATVLKGQTSTPYGWIGIADDAIGGEDHEIVLVNWSGEVLWRTDLRNGPANISQYSHIHDLKYESGTNTVTVLTSNKKSGAFDTNGQNNEHQTGIYILNAASGQVIGWNSWPIGDTTIIEARNTLAKYNAFSLTSNNLDATNFRLKDLYSLDTVGNFDLNKSPGFGKVKRDDFLINYGPNLMQLHNGGEVLKMDTVLKDFNKINFTRIAYKNTSDAIGFGQWLGFTNNKSFWDQLKDLPGLDLNNPNASFQVRINNSNRIEWSTRDNANGWDWVEPSQMALLTSPFWTGAADYGSNNSTYFLHFFFADSGKDRKRTFHIALQFQVQPSKSLMLVGSKMEQLYDDQYTINSPLQLTIENKDWISKQTDLQPDFILKHPANTKINHNLFQPNFVTFAFPTAGVRWTTKSSPSKEFFTPLYDVAQILFKPDGRIAPTDTKLVSSRVFKIGTEGGHRTTDITKAPYMFSRLLSVSPFDNSFVYLGSKRERDSTKFNGWIVRSGSDRWAQRFSINNVDNNKSSYDKLWQEGFGFDPYLNLDNSAKINLYYNHNKHQENYGAPDGFQSNQLGMLGQFNQQSKQTTFDLTTSQNADINSNSYGSIIFSRPNLDQWYPLTTYNFNNPANLFNINQQIVQGNQDLVAIGKNWKPTANNQIDVVSHVQKSIYMDNYRMVKSPSFAISNDLNMNTSLKIKLSWDTSQANFDHGYNRFNGFKDANSKMRYDKTFTINNPSYQIFNKFGALDATGIWTQKAKSWSGNLNNLNLQVDPWDASRQTWWDARKNNNQLNPNQLYGTITNAQSVNGRAPLRIMGQLVAPSGTIPDWFNEFKSQNPKYWQPAPLVGSTNEVPFNTLMSEFASNLIASINNKTTANQNAKALSLANLKINLFYQLDPAIAKNSKIYGNDQKQIAIDNSGKAIIYEVYEQATIYDQSATTFATMKDQGLVDSKIKANWSTVPSSSKLIYQADGQQLKWPIVDSGQSFQNKEKIFQAQYDQTRQNLKIKAVNNSLDLWFKNTLSTMNFKYGLKAVFEGKTTGSAQWQQINQNWSDNDYATKYDNSSKTWTIPTTQSNWKVLRIKLIPIGTNDQNGFINWINFSDDKATSQEVQLGADVIKFDRDWINQTPLNANQTINQLSATDFTNWLDQIKPKVLALNPHINNLWSMLEVKYYFDGKTFNDVNDLIAYLKQQANNPSRADQGWWYLWVGNQNDTSGLKIEISFHIKNQFQNDFGFVDMQNNPISAEQTKSAIDAKIKREFDLKPYFDQLQQNPLVTQVNQQNQISQITMPTGTAGLYNNLDFNTINSKLNSVGIKLQFQAWQNNGWTNQWVDDLNQIKTFNPTNPQIKIRALLKDNVYVNSQPIYGQTNLDQNNPGITLDLQLPKLIQAPTDFATQVQTFANQFQVFAGNTKHLIIKNQDQFETQIFNLIKQASGFNNDHFKQFLKIKYQVGNQNQWVDLQQLVNDLSQATTDLNSNQIDLKFELEGLDSTHPEYVLSTALNNQSFNLLADQNHQVKIYIHGTKWENAIDQIIATGANTNIGYTIPSAFDDLTKAITTGVQLEWKFDLSKDTQWKPYHINPLPNNINQQYPDYINAKAIKIQVSHVSSDQVYHYGPQQDQNPTRKIGTIDLTNLAQNVVVNPAWFDQHPLVKQNSDWSTINEATFSTWESIIKNQIQASDETKSKIKIEYNIVWPNQTSVALSNWNDANGIINTINNAMVNYNDPLHNGIISFYNHQNTNANQTKIVARFAKVNPQDLINFIDANQQPLVDAQLQGVVDSSDIITMLDLSQYWTKIQNQPTVAIVDDPILGTIRNQTIVPPNVDPNQLFGNLTFDNLDQILRTYQINFVFNSQFGANQNPVWNQNGSIGTYNPQDPRLQVAINNQSSNLKIKLSSTTTVNPNADNKNEQTFIKLQVPKLVQIQQSWFDQFIADSGFGGNTKYLEIDQTKVNQLLTKIKDQLKQINPDLAQAPLEIKFQLGSTPLYDVATLQTKLQQIDTDQNNNQIKMQLSLKPGTLNTEWILAGFATNQAENVFVNSSPLKIFLHDQGIWSALNAPQLSGDNQTMQWNFNNGVEVHPTSGLINKPNKQNALKVQYRLNPSDQWQDQQITSFPAGQSTMQIQLTWFNNDAKTKFDFEDVVLNQPYRKQNATFNTNIDKPITVDLTKLKSTLILQSQWLKQIKATGNLINLKLDESQVRKTLVDNHVLPADQIDNIIIQYSIDNKDWKEKDRFEAFLKTNVGKESNQRFILKREAIKTRFALKTNIKPDQYGWQIDNVKIQNIDQYQKHYQQLIDQNHNNQVNGVINLQLVPQFVKDNFWIKGTNLKPKLEVKNQNQILNHFNPYQSENMFRILLSNQKLANGNYNWTNPITIWQNGQFVENLGLTFKDLKNAAIKFEAFSAITNDNNHYLVKSDQNEPTQSELIFDISDQIKVISEIINPFTNANKKLAIQVRNDQNKAQWHQGQGQFKIMLGDSNWQIDSSKQSAWDFLQTSQDLSDNEKTKLEFAYTIFKTKPDQQVINDAKQNISNWNRFENPNKWSGDLKLKVGDYVMVALRVKKEFASGEQAYVLQNNDHSFLIPVNDQISDVSQPISKREPGRISGLLIDPENANVQDNVLLKATNPTLTNQLIDGWVQLDQLEINNDQNQADGLDLKLNLYNSFHLDPKTHQPLVSASNALLVERDQTNADQGAAYVDAQGTEIVDANGQKVHLWIDRSTKKPAKPKEQTNVTQTMQLNQRNDGIYQLALVNNPNATLFNLFKNQKVVIEYQAKVGLGTQTQPDFELTKSYSQDLAPIINPQIKFVLENPQNIIYDFANRNEFADGIVQFEAINSTDQIATNGAARVQTVLKLARNFKNDTSQNQIISANSGIEAAQLIKQTIEQDFTKQLKFNITRVDKDANVNTINDSANIYQLEDLKNGDQIRLSLTTSDPDLIYLDAPQDLIINVNGLATVAPDRAALRFLRVEQSGKIDGQGSFRVLVNDPNGAINNSDQILKGWKFLIRVWDRSKTIKINWTDDQSLITNLNNGDRVEWKLVDANKNPVTDAYYNTIAMTHDEVNGIYNYGQVNYPNGQSSLNVIKNEIGSYPLDETKYPETSGFVINNLVAKDQIKPFNLTQFAFEKIIKTLNPTYYGQNGNGALRFNEQYLSGTWYVDLEGNIYQEPKYQNQDSTQALQEITLENFFANTTFYLDNPVTNPAQVGFKFKANLTNTGNQLKNGDQVYAQFDIEGAGWSAITGLNDNNSTNNDQVLTSTLVTQLPDVNNLVNSVDPLSAFWWILITIATLGFGGLIWALINKWKNPKLRIKEFKD